MKDQEKPLRIVLSGGGTGGHIYPALALAETIKQCSPDTKFLYIGSKRGLEKNIVPKFGYAFESLRIQGLKRSLSLDNIKTVYYLMTSIGKAKKMLKEFAPDVVIGTGGYVCAPVLYAAHLLNIPTIIHEQNSVAGVTNKLLSRFVDRICISFDDVRKDFAGQENKIVMTGNPRGQQVVTYLKEHPITSKSGVEVVIFGGSRGSEVINQAFVDAFDGLSDKPYHVTMISGAILYDDLLKALNGKKAKNITIVPYVDNMPELFAITDFVVCRSGATTLTELTALGLASLLIPSPYVTHNHQEANALSLVHQGAAEMILQKDLTGDAMVTVIDRYALDQTKRQKMAEEARKMGITNASNRIISIINDVL
ncbi:MAG: undecaprenyldiphospho-muramoylpentapeptide beta-N-acetylglucosaminyltransferase [Bavariicoccus seileri]|uniref:UDP-N-acetylglucosamine--N-acetylmuramyl-(pentapeptide) pyrophosphoryl-undecaprenol N-acetylglucosamine transferase n=1 Tax=Bavariicoccus seileri TaxID=549685 RepID=A0A3D4S434_9ENTE|nr:undecaprenyldiphospho-muramoylpentapeptide beta-N-acetylglucosaminyltransferase [Bavariicoccus seileri]HCS93573.1 undecaprenyldiphospho-muramoylpentapeptide beta-N-acetylglucosaminyltransferase [Bavariicoccus seileri]